MLWRGRLAGGTVSSSQGRTSPTQVSWSVDHKSARAGTYEVRFFDEESYSLLRKVRVGLREGGRAPLHSCLCPAAPLTAAPRPIGTSSSGSKSAGWAFPVFLSRLVLLFHNPGQCSCLPNPLPALPGRTRHPSLPFAGSEK